ncbi:MAG: AMP-binding protein [Oceanicaulis sp.]
MAEAHPLCGDLEPLTSPVDVLARAARAAPDALALKSGAVSLTYAEYAAAAQGLSLRLIEAGARGRAVVIALPNCAEMVVAIFAVQAAGAQVCTVNPGYTARELAHVIKDADPALILHDAALAPVIAEAAGDHHGPRWAIRPGERGWLDALASEGDAASLTIPPGEALATLQYTGGTSGRPKGVMLTHAAVAANIDQREAFLPTGPGERVLCIMPLFHVFAVSMCLHLAAYRAGTLIVLPRYKPDLVVDAFRDEQISLFPAGPTVFNGLVAFDAMTREAAASLKACYSGSAPLSTATLERWEALTGAPIYEGYGQTEAGPILTYHSPHFSRKAGSVGKAVPGTAVKIVAADDAARVLPVGEAGEIVARGPQIMAGYRSLPQETAEALQDGWLHTGDIGRFDADGYLFIEDRKKDMVVTAGFNVFPREIDEVLGAHPDVVEAACVGAPDDYRGEILKAAVVLRAGAAADLSGIEAHCAAQLVKYKRPAVIEIWDALPKTSVGKIDKRAVKAKLCEVTHVA